VTDQREIRTGDCVAIERVRETANIRRVAQSFDRANTRAVASVEDFIQSEATACEAAKQELVPQDERIRAFGDMVLYSTLPRAAVTVANEG
jgi:hypothetical protein